MAWFRNFYHCGDCGNDWEDEWSCCCDDECPWCGSRHWSPVKSEDLTEVIWQATIGYAVMRSPAEADDRPRYIQTALFGTIDEANRFVRDGELI